MNCFNSFYFLKRKTQLQIGRPQTGQAGLQAGQGPEWSGLWPAQAALQAGAVAEASGPVPAQAGRAGRAPARGLRPQDGPSTARPGARARHHAVAAGGNLRRERDRGRGKLAEKERSSPPVKLWVLDDGGADEGRQNRGRRTTAAAEVVEDAGDAPDDPGSIPLVRRELTAWRGGRRPRLAPGRLQSATTRW